MLSQKRVEGVSPNFGFDDVVTAKDKLIGF